MKAVSELEGATPAEAPGEAIRVRGLVQGVGFRPAVWRLATECGLTGEVGNDPGGVFIRLWGPPERRARFLQRLQDEQPPLARIESLQSEPLYRPAPDSGFHIAPSEGGRVHTGVVPDAATCGECLADIAEPGNRRYRYAFANCTHCGPRLSIVRAIPYDRANTSMAGFPLCRACAGEYDNPLDRRFHAQPNACPECGPELWLEDFNGAFSPGADAVATAAKVLRDGWIVAIKGIGGIHLAVDAGNDTAVRRLRERKQRQKKPFALMARDIETVRRYCIVDDPERALLESPAAPIVLLQSRSDHKLPWAVAPNQRALGFMLPYTPLHHLLMREMDGPVVLTSGNRSEAPQCTANEEVRTTLADIADFRLLHNRPIVNRVDDSVARVMDGAPRVMRRARGYAPEPIRLPPGFGDAPPLLAMGAELKNTFCLAGRGEAVLSQHIGDLENAATYAEYRRNLSLYRQLYEHQPVCIAVDRHPEYLSTKWGREQADAMGLPLESVQHHHAHIAACLAENGIPLGSAPVLGIALDGLGLGDDGTLWGGEFLLADYRGFSRLGCFTPVPMIGGAKAIREPWRSTYAHLRASPGWQTFERQYAPLDLYNYLRTQPLATLEGMLHKGLNTPLTSSCGRLFDAVAAAVGICRDRVDYEGQAAMELEAWVDAAALDATGDEGYDFHVVHGQVVMLDSAPLWPALLDDLAAGRTVGIIAARFHVGLARAVVALAGKLAGEQGVSTVALAGGVFQNRILLEHVSAGLRRLGYAVLSPRRIPANDGGLSLGQAAVAAARMKARDEVTACV